MNNSVEGTEEEDDFYENDNTNQKQDDEDEVIKKSDSEPKSKRKSNNKSKRTKVRGPEYNIPEDATPESMKEINDKLRSELEQLIEAVDSQIQRVKKEKEDERKQLLMREDPDADVRRKENELKKAQAKIQNLKKEILQMKKQIDHAYDVEKNLVHLKYQMM